MPKKVFKILDKKFPKRQDAYDEISISLSTITLNSFESSYTPKEIADHLDAGYVAQNKSR